MDKPRYIFVLTAQAEEMGFTQTMLAKKMGRPIQAINEIFLGKKRVTEETALQFEKVLGISAILILILQSHHFLEKAKSKINSL